MVRRLVALSLAAGLGFASGCAPTGGDLRVPRPPQSETSVRLHDHSLTVHVSAGPRSGPLLVYATGDAGWWGKDKEIFTRLVLWGYPSAGFSSRDYVRHLGPNVDAEPLAALASDYAGIIAASEVALGLPDTTRVVLVGKSRGAGLAVAAAAVPVLRRQLDGLLMVGLTREEEYVRRPLRGTRRRSPPVMLETYDVLPQIGSVPVVVIQSTGDEYVSAPNARELFGPDTPVRRLVAIESPNHNFSGALPALYAELERSLQWILDR
jgi:pimeloyl-ACP methyl ester carboxylesterase